jgi:subtilisin family serine protease
MRQRRAAALLALALLIAVPVAPAVAVEPVPDLSPVAPVRQPGTPEPTPNPTAEPVPADPLPADPLPTEPAPAEPTPAPEPVADAAPSAEPAAEPAGKPGADYLVETRRPRGGLDPRNRYIVVLERGADLAATVTRGKRLGAKVERTFRTTFRGYVATLTGALRARLAKDPAVAMIVPDEIVELTAQHTPMGVRRVKLAASDITSIDGVDDGIDADVAIVDTGIDPTHPDLNVAGGYNCSTSDRTLWRDQENHGTHVAGTVGARDNGFGVVGVAPGVRLWAVKILNDDGFGYLSWYVCGLDWIAAQRDPNDPSRPLFEAVNMSVAKKGADDRACGTKNADILHAAICRVVAAGIPVVAAAGNDRGNASTLVPASYDEVITVSALADSDGLPGGKGGSLCYSWGTYDQDDTLADFSNGGYDVDLIAPGKCIWSTIPGNRYAYSSGTSMAAPHVTGAVALYQATRPDATVTETKAALQYLGTLDWRYWTDRDAYHEKLLDVGRLDRLGDFSISIKAPAAAVPETGAALTLPVTVGRSWTFFERVNLSLAVENGITATFASSASLYGWTATSSSIRVVVPPATPPGSYTVRVTGRNWGRERSGSTTIVVEGDAPVARAAVVHAATSTQFDTTALTLRALWEAATDKSSRIAAYQFEYRVDGGGWTGTTSLPSTARSVAFRATVGRMYETRLRAQDAAGYWSAWAVSAGVRPTGVQDSSTAVTYHGTWSRYANAWMSGGSTRYAGTAGKSVAHTFTGRAVSIVMPKGPTRGSARIYLDGTLVATISTYASSVQGRRIVWSRAFASAGTHTLRIVVAGTPGHARIDFDAVVVMK